MKNSLLSLSTLLLLLITLPASIIGQRYWVSAGAGTWSGDNWAAASGGAPDGAGPPTAGVDAIFNAAGLGNCTLDVNASFDGINTTGYTGIIDLAGFTFDPAVTGAAGCTFASGTINDGAGTSSVTFTTTATATFSGTIFTTPINATVGAISFSGGTYGSPVTIIKNGATTVSGLGGCTFNSTLSITNNGTSHVLMGNTNPDIFNGDLTLINNSTGRFRMAYNSAGNQFNGNIIVGSTAGTGVWLGEGGGSSSTIATGKSLSIHAGGFSAGDLRLHGITQADASAINLTLTGTARFLATNNSTFLGPLTITSPNLYVFNSTFNGVVNLTKNGGTSDASAGGNTFNAQTTLTNTGSTYFGMGNGNADIFNADLYLINTGSERILLGQSNAPNQYNGNVFVEQTGSATGVYLAYAGNSSATIAAGKTVSIAGAGVSAGIISLARVTQLGADPISLNTTGTAGVYLGPSSTFEGDVTIEASLIYCHGALYKSPVSFTKTGTVNCHNNGNQNIFNSTLEVNQQGTGYIMFSYQSNSLFQDDITLTSTNTGIIYFGYVNGTGTPTLSAGKTILIGGAGYNQGTLYLGSFTQLGNAPMTLPLSGANFTINNIPNPCVFGGALDVTADQIIVGGGTFNGATSFTKNAAAASHNSGKKNIFNSTLEITNQGAGYLMLGYLSDDEFHDDITINCTGTGFIRLGHSAGIQSPTLDAGKTIKVGAGGMLDGGLFLGSFTQLGNEPMNLPFSNLSTLNFFQSTIGGNLVSSSELVTFVNSTFNGTVNATSTGTGQNGGGGNTFNQNVVFDNAGVSPWYTGLTTKDDFLGDLTVTSSGTNLTNIAHNTLNNTIAGNLTTTNAAIGAGARTLSICNGSLTSSLAIGGNLTASNTGSATTLNTYIAENGVLTIGGDVTLSNSATGTTSDLRISNGVNSSTDITGNTSVVNDNSATTTNRVWLGVSGDIEFNGTLDMVNNAGNTNSEIFLNYAASSVNNYYQDITLGTYNTTCDGYFFGVVSGVPGTGTLHAGKTITIPGVDLTNFLGGSLYFRGFTQTGGATPHSFELPATANYIFNYDSNWGSNVIFKAPRIYNQLSTFSGTSYFEKTGAVDDNLGGGNNYVGNAEFVLSNNVANGLFQIANAAPSQFGGDVTMRNLGSFGVLDLGAAIGAYNIAGNLTLENNSTGTGTQNMYVCEGVTSSFTIGGDVTITNSSNSAGTHNVGLAMNGSMIINGNTSVSNINSNGTSKYIYLGSAGSITFEGTLSMISNSDATNNHFYLNNSPTSNNTYKGDITVQSLNTASDGFWFGNAAGSGTLEAGNSISIPGVDVTNFIGGRLYFRNFTQTGNTPHSFELASTADYIYNYDSQWGGDVNFVSPRFYNRGTTFERTSYFEKTGAVNDDSYGDNTYTGNAEFVLNNNVAAGRIYLATSLPSSFGGNLIARNIGAFNELMVANSAGTHNIAGDVLLENAATGAAAQYVYMGNNDAGIVNIGGDLIVDNISNGPSTKNMYISNRGVMNITGSATVNNTGSNGTAKYIYFGNVGSINVGTTLDAVNSTTATSGSIYLANNVASTVDITGNTNILNDATGATTTRYYIGEYGSVNFGGTVDMVNNGDATNSQVYIAYRGPVTFAENITVTTDNVDSDGFHFGTAGGTSDLALNKTITIPGGGLANFIGGDLYLRNFTQNGAIDHDFNLANTAGIITNWSSSWGGNVDFRAPGIANRETTFAGTGYFEKKGAGNSDSYGGNSYGGNTEFVMDNNEAGGRFYLGMTMPSSVNGDLTLRHKGTFDNLLFGQAAGTYNITGDLLMDLTATGVAANYIYIGNNAGTIINVAGNGTFTNTSAGISNNKIIYVANNGTLNIGGNAVCTNSGVGGVTKQVVFGNTGDINLTGDLTILNSGSATTTNTYVASGAASEVTIGGNTIATNSGTGTTSRVYLGNSGDITFDGDVSIINSTGAINSQFYCNTAAGAHTDFNGNITIENTHVSGDEVSFGSGSGSATLADTKTVTISAGGFASGLLYFRNFTQDGTTPQVLTTTGSSTLTNHTSTWGGEVTFTSPRIYTHYSTYESGGQLEQDGPTNTASAGGNTYNGDMTIKNNGTGYFMPANGIADDYNANASFIKTGSGVIHPTHNSASTFAGDVNIDHAGTSIYFGAAGNGRAIFDGNGAQAINDLGPSVLPRYRDFQVNKPGGELTLNMPAQITVELDLDQGVVNTTSFALLQMNHNTFVSSVSDASYIAGPIQKTGNTAFDFPVGKAGFYRPISISNPASTAHHFTAEFFATDPDGIEGPGPVTIESPIDNISDCEHWILDRTNGASNVNVTLSFRDYNGGCSGVGDLSSLSIARWDVATRTWTNNVSTAVGVPTGTITTNSAITTFSPFALASANDGNDLPIELINFEAKLSNSNDVLLTWQTASEINNDYFTIERSTNGIDFEYVAEIKGAGNSTAVLDYNTTDFTPYNGQSFYRLKQTDFDGTTSYSEVETINLESDNDISIYPNPLSESTSVLNIVSQEKEIDEITIMDNLGRVVMTKVFGSTNAEINVDSFDAGVYFVKIQNGSQTTTKRIVIQ